jgi:hypothetical protein
MPTDASAELYRTETLLRRKLPLQLGIGTVTTTQRRRTGA